MAITPDGASSLPRAADGRCRFELNQIGTSNPGYFPSPQREVVHVAGIRTIIGATGI